VNLTLLNLTLLTYAMSTLSALAGEVIDLRSVTSFESEPQILREGNSLFIGVSNSETSSVLIPRVYASLKYLAWKNNEIQTELSLHPETEYWTIRSSGPIPEDAEIVLEFDTSPMLNGEIKAITQLGDGRFDLHAYQANTHGKKLRFEPQPYKNTVGYWVNPKDFATWTVDIERPGKFNVGLLQGCGPEQGGSVATLSIEKDARVIDEVDFTVEETGHFQNFIWRTVGVIEIPEPGRYTVKLQPKHIEKAALMDVRQIQFVRIP